MKNEIVLETWAGNLFFMTNSNHSLLAICGYD